jgi:transcription antitermination factor NusG
MINLDKNPPIVYSAATRGHILEDSDWAQPWTVAHCKPRQEKALAWDLHKRGTSYFLPMVLRETSSGGRRRKNLYPLFASYLFLPAGEADRLAALKTNRVVRLIAVNDAQQPSFKREIQSLETALRNCPDSLELYPRLAVGTRVLVKSGPLKGIEGVVLQTGQKRKLWLGVSALGVGATVEIHPDLVDPV